MNFSPQITQITQKGNGHKKAQKAQEQVSGVFFVLLVPFRG